MVSFLTAFLLLASPAAILESAMRDIARDAKGVVGAAALVIDTGEFAAISPDSRFPMQSVYKFPIAMAVLREVDKGRLKLDQKILVRKEDLLGPRQHSPIRDLHPGGNVEYTLRELLRLNTAESDGTACDVLLRVIGGPARVMDYLRSLGIDGITVANTEMEIGSAEDVQYRNWATPRAAVQLLRAFHQGRGLSPESRSLLLQWLVSTPTGARRLRAMLPPSAAVAHKTGSSRTVNGITAATNDIGLVTLPGGRRLAIAVFVSDSAAPDLARDAVIARIALAAWHHWSK